MYIGTIRNRSSAIGLLIAI